ncbi:MAG: UDP-N-acetylmuramoyl-L-alanine--D-glutamate ligase [Lachnospiraceae bacterium]|nr:UDP-N-acetylmuramoyl-L-alanine--D-glutamate ligase [Lachnospiraceae bacterium]
MNLKDKKVLIIGCGKSGIGAAGLLHQAGACPVLFDAKTDLDVQKIKEKLAPGVCAEIVLGEVGEELKKQLSLVVVSPGVQTDTPFMKQFFDAGLPVWGEIELAYQFGSGRVIAITGTNGKTTTTTLVGEIMKNYFGSVFVVGNIGNPYTDAALSMKSDSVTVAEISSFQLETVREFHPAVSAVLNITPDHLDRHHTMENYAAVKASVSKNQTAEDFCILNAEDPYTEEIAAKCKASVILFSSRKKLETGYYLDGDMICSRFDKKETALLNVHHMHLIGVHNYENVMAAIAVSAAFGVPMDVILETVKHFRAVEHRIEYVAEKKGVIYYNDSKGTNPDAAIKAIRAMSRPTILIGGGYDKQNTYDEWIESFDGKVKLFVLIGQTREAIAACARAHGLENIVMADTFEEALDICVTNAVPGDAVLLSPACASWGMFPNYEVRGQMFKEYVNGLEE